MTVRCGVSWCSLMPRLSISLDDSLHAELTAAAGQARRSLAAEIAYRLEQSMREHGSFGAAVAYTIPVAAQDLAGPAKPDPRPSKK